MNIGVHLIKEKTMSIDETPKKIEEEQAGKDTPKKQGVVKKIITYGLILFSLGIYYPKSVDAGSVNVGAENGKINVYVTPGGSVGVNAQTGEHVVFPGGGNVGMTRDGRVVVAPGNNSADNTQDTCQSKISEYDANIARDPTSAKLYIAKADEMIKNKASPREIINTYETALRQKNLKATANEEGKIYAQLGDFYQGNENKLFYYKKHLTLVTNFII